MGLATCVVVFVPHVPPPGKNRQMMELCELVSTKFPEVLEVAHHLMAVSCPATC